MKKIIGFIICFFILGVISITNASTFYIYNGHKYWVVEEPGISWEAAQEIAVNSGGYLATITSPEEQAFIEENLPLVWYLWIGGYQTAPSNDPSANWAWVTGEPWSYTNWGPGEPNDYFGYASEEYLTIRGDGMWNDLWNDPNRFNSYIQGFIVEAPVPIPGTIWLLGAGLAGVLGIKFFRKNT